MDDQRQPDAGTMRAKRRSWRKLGLYAAVWVVFCSLAWGARLKSDETAVLFPGLAWPAAEDGGWEVEIRAWVLEREPRRWSLAVLTAALDLGGVKWSQEEEVTFRRRARWFLADNERRKRLEIELRGERYPLNPTDAAGLSTTRISLKAGPTGDARKKSEASFSLPIRIVTRPSDALVITGVVFFVPAEGVSVISDIDDTIKVSEVRDRSALLRNTFLRPYREVPGMANLYQGWARKSRATFHYVSASPWQLQPELADFLSRSGFPPGSFHLKEFRWKDERFWNLFESPERYKPGVIEALLERYPRRKLVLIGDSGERDPEIYGALARRHQDQVCRILIRDVTGQTLADPRYRQAFEGLVDGVGCVFESPDELRALDLGEAVRAVAPR